MIESKVRQGSIGVNTNHDYKLVLLQATDNEEQVRIVMTVEEAEFLIHKLEDVVKTIRNKEIIS